MANGKTNNRIFAFTAVLVLCAVIACAVIVVPVSKAKYVQSYTSDVIFTTQHCTETEGIEALLKSLTTPSSLCSKYWIESNRYGKVGKSLDSGGDIYGIPLCYELITGTSNPNPVPEINFVFRMLVTSYSGKTKIARFTVMYCYMTAADIADNITRCRAGETVYATKVFEYEIDVKYTSKGFTYTPVSNEYINGKVLLQAKQSSNDKSIWFLYFDANHVTVA